MKTYHFKFFCWEKTLLFNLKFSQKLFLYVFFKFCFLSTYMFDFNKWDLKWKFMILFIHFSQKIRKNAKKNILLRLGDNLCSFFLILRFTLFIWNKTPISLQSGETYTESLEKVRNLIFLASFFFRQSVDVERLFIYKTYWCNKSCITLIRLADLVYIC